MGVSVLRNGTRVPKLVSQLRNTLRNGALAAKLGIFTLYSFAAVSQLRNGFAKDGRFRRDTLIPQRLLLGCETVSQQSANFAEDSLRLQNLADPCFCPVFALFSLRKTFFQFLCIFFHLRSFKKCNLHINTQFKIKK